MARYPDDLELLQASPGPGAHGFRNCIAAR
jgi:hypothetical protein